MNNMKKRIMDILKIRKYFIASLMAAAVIVGVIGVFLLTEAVESNEEKANLEIGDLSGFTESEPVTSPENEDTQKAVELLLNEIDNECLMQLVERSLNIQYKHQTEELTKTYTKDFIDKIDESFYKEKSGSYKILNITSPVKDEKTNNVLIHVRLQDSKGQYIQEITFEKYSGSYFISGILNDI